jgi:hypothetical protein
MMKIICKDNHWKVKDGQLILDTPEGQESVKSMVHILEAQIRGRIYDEICAVDFTSDRKRVMKNGLENALLTVQDICAQVALGASRESN